MNYDLNDNSSLITFFNQLFQNTDLTKDAPNIMKFFIITRNYGLIDFKDNIDKITNNKDMRDLAIEAIKKGFEKDNIIYNKHHLLALLIDNFHQNGFYFHSFPGAYNDSIKENGILANNRTSDDEKYYEIVKKYNFGDYFSSSDNRVCVSEKISNFSTHEYSLFTPEWLEMFLKLGNDMNTVHEAFRRGNLEEMINLTKDSLANIKNDMMKNNQYDENDYSFLEKYITGVVYNRFQNGNDTISIALIEKQKSVDYFGKYIASEDYQVFHDYIIARKLEEKEIFNFIIESMSNGEKDSEKSIPKDLINIVSYQLKTETLENNKTL